MRFAAIGRNATHFAMGRISLFAAQDRPIAFSFISPKSVLWSQPQKDIHFIVRAFSALCRMSRSECGALQPFWRRLRLRVSEPSGFSFWLQVHRTG